MRPANATGLHAPAARAPPSTSTVKRSARRTSASPRAADVARARRAAGSPRRCPREKSAVGGGPPKGLGTRPTPPSAERNPARDPAHRLAHPAGRLRRLPAQHRKPGNERRRSRRERHGGTPPAGGERQEDERGDAEDPEIVAVQNGRRGGRSRDEARGRLVSRERQQKCRQPEEAEQGVGPGFRRVQREEQGARREADEDAAGDSARERARGREDGERGRERGQPKQPVGVAGALGERGERLLENVEAGRPGVGAEHREQFRERETRGPGREDFVEPQGPLEEEQDARRERNRREEDESPRGGPPASDFGFDALS